MTKFYEIHQLPALILDDWLMVPIRNQVKEFILLDLIDERNGTAIRHLLSS